MKRLPPEKAIPIPCPSCGKGLLFNMDTDNWYCISGHEFPTAFMLARAPIDAAKKSQPS